MTVISGRESIRETRNRKLAVLAKRRRRVCIIWDDIDGDLLISPYPIKSREYYDERIVCDERLCWEISWGDKSDFLALLGVFERFGIRTRFPSRHWQEVEIVVWRISSAVLLEALIIFDREGRDRLEEIVRHADSSKTFLALSLLR